MSPLSLALPFLAFTPGFIILTGWIIFGEKMSAGGFWGVILIMTGTFIMIAVAGVFLIGWLG